MLKILVPALFYAPTLATYLNPLLGVVVPTFMVFWHYRHQPFKRALDQLEKNWPEPYNPGEIIFD